MEGNTVKRRRPSFWRRAVGEISKLRLTLSTLSWALRGGVWGTGFKLDSSRVDVKKARALYDNTDDTYKLGAGFAKPIINTAVAFMGVPQFRTEDEEAQAVLDEFAGRNVSRMQQTHRDALRDGDCFVMITRQEIEEDALYPEAKVRFVYNILPREQVVEVIRDPLTGAPQEYILASEHEWLDANQARRRATVKRQISAKRILTEIVGDTPPGVTPGEEPNNWGFIPIIHFRNEGDSSAVNGKSELEPVEPFLKAYHDVMLQAVQGSRLHSNPKLKLKIKDIRQFLRLNFGVTDIEKFLAEGGKLNLSGNDVVILQEGDEAGVLEASSPMGAAEPLLKLIFYCIVDTSETPEFAFGVHTPSSLSSVKEQMPVLVRRIARKREHFTESWQRLARVVLAMHSQAEGKKFASHATTLLWDEVNPKDDKDLAETLERFVNALKTAIESGLMSLEAAVMFLKGYVETMNDYVSDDPEIPGERERIIRTKILLSRLEEGELTESERRLIEEALAGKTPAA